jgi:hypothetical protein
MNISASLNEVEVINVYIPDFELDMASEIGALSTIKQLIKYYEI